MNKPEEISDPDPKQPSRSSSDEVTVTVADRDRSDQNQGTEELNDQFRNVGLDDDDSANERSVPISEGNVETESRALGSDQKEEEEEEERRERENNVEKRMIVYPVRPDAEDCSYYMRTGSCKYGSSCKFNHPLRRRLQIGREKVREREEDVDNLKLMMECKYYFRTGGCKYGESCRFSHMKEQTSLASRPELNFLGLPIRPGEKECPFYMRNGSCKFGSDCKFNHPDPTAIGGVDSPMFRGNNGGSVGSFSPKAPLPQVSSTSWSSSRHMNGTGTAPFIPAMFPQNRGVSSPQASEWNGYQASSPYPPERSVLPPSTYSMNINNSIAETSSFSQYQQQSSVEEFPERPDQPECTYYLKTGDCKFKYKCKYHHPKNRLPKQAPSSFNDKGLPLRPDQSMCTHYSRYGICKFGPACRFDHSIPPTFSSSSSLTVEGPQAGANGNEDDSWH
ncbi:PREDICTED: zinc finger CCCH domain-containing protein 67 [Camelina sativa]|uniref:Zinc finger CCCH domain-containing protein 67 n=1 Tax=Camelina sativa TaxID=90675 RepID=A0ABM0VRE7_CAMSA|nr:PREDICTED: zinc finger CCCH domain-containing protein 67 [Camelina sativa]